ncbi:MAG: hypothetical protein H8E30_09665, partial [Alphaproteobacteria bacterium]|nr:hypothetical protein [Alphaproteobacteria bacterium]
MRSNSAHALPGNRPSAAQISRNKSFVGNLGLVEVRFRQNVVVVIVVIVIGQR